MAHLCVPLKKKTMNDLKPQKWQHITKRKKHCSLAGTNICILRAHQFVSTLKKNMRIILQSSTWVLFTACNATQGFHCKPPCSVYFNSSDPAVLLKYLRPPVINVNEVDILAFGWYFYGLRWMTLAITIEQVPQGWHWGGFGVWQRSRCHWERATWVIALVITSGTSRPCITRQGWRPAWPLGWLVSCWSSPAKKIVHNGR